MIHFHRYRLVLRGAWKTDVSSSSREGALLRLRMNDGTTGHADLFAWPELGDASLNDLLLMLARVVRQVSPNGPRKIETGGFSNTEVSSLHAKLEEIAIAHVEYRQLPRLFDAISAELKAIGEKRSVLEGSIINHFTCLSVANLAAGDVLFARRGGFPAIKVKSRASLEDADALSRLQGHWQIGLRIDCNERSDPETLLHFLDRLPIRILEQIDFIEDPFPFSLEGWRKFHQKTGLRLAIDRPATRLAETELLEALSAGAAQVYVHKPQWTKSQTALLVGQQKHPAHIVVTSALGHPIGNLYAASVAQTVAPDSTHGCLTHLVYQEDEAARSLIASGQIRGARMFGNGIGFGLGEKSLQQMSWQSLPVGPSTGS